MSVHVAPDEINLKASKMGRQLGGHQVAAMEQKTHAALPKRLERLRRSLAVVVCVRENADFHTCRTSLVWTHASLKATARTGGTPSSNVCHSHTPRLAV